MKKVFSSFFILSFFMTLWSLSPSLSHTHTNIHTPTNAHTHPHPNTHYLFLSVYLEFSCLWEDWSICSICFWNCSLICSTVALSLAFFVYIWTNIAKGSHKKSSFFFGPGTKTLTPLPPPSNLVAKGNEFWLGYARVIFKLIDSITEWMQHQWLS